MSLVSVATILSMAFAGTWALFQVQLSSVNREIDLVNKTTAATFASLDNEIDKVNVTLRTNLTSTYIPRTEFEQFQLRFDAIRAQITLLGDRQADLVGRSAREPVERATIEAINAAVDKQIAIIQGQISDINRQIAAALIIIDSNSNTTKHAVPQ
jgi:hypothetical protein